LLLGDTRAYPVFAPFPAVSPILRVGTIWDFFLFLSTVILVTFALMIPSTLAADFGLVLAGVLFPDVLTSF